MHRLAAVLVLALACAHSPAPPPGPRPLGGSAAIQRGDADVSLALRYQLPEPKLLEISAELRGGGSGSVGAVTVELHPDGLDLEGDAAWTAEAAAGQSVSHSWRLRPSRDGVVKLEVRHGLPDKGAALDTTTIAAFRVGSDAIRLCATADCADVEP